MITTESDRRSQNRNRIDVPNRLEPSPKEQRLVEAQTRQVQDELTQDIIAELNMDERFGSCSSIEQLAEVVSRKEGQLRELYESWVSWLQDVLPANISYDGLPIDIDEAERAELSAQHLEKVLPETSQLLIDAAPIVPFAFVAPKLLDSELINGHDLKDVARICSQRLQEKARGVVYSFFASIEAAIGSQQLGRIVNREKPSPSATFFEYRIVDEVGNVTKQRVWGTSRLRRVERHHEMIAAKHYCFDATLRNPSLDIPSRFRKVLAACPPLLRPYIHSSFGTQITDRAIATNCEWSAHISVDRKPKVITYPQPSRPSKAVDLIADIMATSFEYDPCICLFNQFVLFGWGREMNEHFEEHQRVVDMQSRLLREAARLSAQRTTYFICGLSLMAVVCFQSWLFTFNLVNIMLVGPALLVAFVFLVHGMRCSRQARVSTTESIERPKEAFRILCLKHRDFDPSEPRLVSPEATAELPASRRIFNRSTGRKPKP